jgi:hypothetical protein
MIAASGSAAIFLNMLGASCLTQLARIDRSSIMTESVEELERNCFIITNSYVYSLFGVVAGAIMLAYWYKKNKK